MEIPEKRATPDKMMSEGIRSKELRLEITKIIDKITVKIKKLREVQRRFAYRQQQIHIPWEGMTCKLDWIIKERIVRPVSRNS